MTLNRQQKRAQERRAAKYDSRQSFTRKEVEHMTVTSFQAGTAMALYAAGKVLGLGEVRLDRVRAEIQTLEFQYFQERSREPLPFDIAEMNRYKGDKKHV